jgi:hypothetical protein
VSAAD